MLEALKPTAGGGNRNRARSGFRQRHRSIMRLWEREQGDGYVMEREGKKKRSSKGEMTCHDLGGGFSFLYSTTVRRGGAIQNLSENFLASKKMHRGEKGEQRPNRSTSS